MPATIYPIMDHIDLRGMGVALATPFHPDLTVDYEALRKLVLYQISNGADYLVVLATTSEAATLSCHERRAIATCVAETVGHRVPLILGMSGNCTADLARHIGEVDFTG